MNIDTLENQLDTKFDQTFEKNSKNQNETVVCEQKMHQRENEFLCSNIVFSLYFIFRAEKIHAANTFAFSFNFLFRRDQNDYFNLTSKIMKMCEQIFKKNSRTSPVVQFKKFSLTKEKT